MTTPVVLTKEAAEQVRAALAEASDTNTKLAADLAAAQAKIAEVEKVAAQKVAAARVDLSKTAAELADQMLAQQLIGAQYRDVTASALADPVKLASYFKKSLDLLAQKTAATAPRRLGEPVEKKAAPAAADSKSRLAEADRAFVRAVGLG